jgi:hypothetical protein
MGSSPAIPMLFFGLLLYGLMFFGIIYVVWKFYRILSKINDNIAGVKQALERERPDTVTTGGDGV